MRMRWFLALSSALLLVIGVTVVLDDALDSATGGGDQVISGPSDEAAPVVGATAEERGYLEVAGHVDDVHLEQALLDDPHVATPLTIESDRGFGNGGEITSVVVAGKPSSIVWDGGRPFVLSSGPGLVLDLVTVDLGQDHELRCSLAGGAHGFADGDYELDTPVAVGGEGIATPREHVEFRANRSARFEGRGDAALVLPSDQQHTFTGPGLVHLAGDLLVMTETGQQPASSLDLRNGGYELTLSPTEGGGWTISGRVQSLVVGDLLLGQ